VRYAGSSDKYWTNSPSDPAGAVEVYPIAV
jgi:hypothetical protein